MYFHFNNFVKVLRNGDYIYLLTIFSFHYKYCKRSNHIKQYKIKTRPYMIFVCFMVFNATFNNISVISWWSVLFGRGYRSTRRKIPTCRKSLTKFICHSTLYILNRTCIFEYSHYFNFFLKF